MAKYLKFLDIFLKKKAFVLLKLIKLNQYAIKLEKSKKLSYELIYSLKLEKVKIFKIYIKINLANSFIWPFKSLVNAFILFVKELNNGF